VDPLGDTPTDDQTRKRPRKDKTDARGAKRPKTKVPRYEPGGIYLNPNVAASSMFVSISSVLNQVSTVKTHIESLMPFLLKNQRMSASTISVQPTLDVYSIAARLNLSDENSRFTNYCTMLNSLYLVMAIER
jgi:hypothetical protein